MNWKTKKKRFIARSMLSHRWVPTSNTKVESFGDIMGRSLFLSTKTFDMRLYGARWYVDQMAFAMGSYLAGSHTAE
jgi:hypothetical protein